MKVKIFVDSFYSTVEEEINDFINGEEVKEVIDIKQSVAYASHGESIVITAMVIYKENNKANKNAIGILK